MGDIYKMFRLLEYKNANESWRATGVGCLFQYWISLIILCWKGTVQRFIVYNAKNKTETVYDQV